MPISRFLQGVCVFHKCLNCGKSFKFWPSNSAGKFCSRNCSYDAMKRTSEVVGGMQFRKTIARLGKHHAEQQVRVALSFKGAPREEIVVAMDDLMREQRLVRSEILRRYRNITKNRRRKMMKAYRESLDLARRVYKDADGRKRFDR